MKLFGNAKITRNADSSNFVTSSHSLVRVRWLTLTCTIPICEIKARQKVFTVFSNRVPMANHPPEHGLEHCSFLVRSLFEGSSTHVFAKGLGHDFASQISPMWK